MTFARNFSVLAILLSGAAFAQEVHASGEATLTALPDSTFRLRAVARASIPVSAATVSAEVGTDGPLNQLNGHAAQCASVTVTTQKYLGRVQVAITPDQKLLPSAEVSARLTERLQLGAAVMKINDKAVVSGSLTVRGDGVSASASANSMGAVSLTVGFAR